MKHSARGEIVVIAVVGIACLAAGLFFGPRIRGLDSRSRDADKSAEVTKKVEEALQKRDQAEAKKGGVITASVNEINTAASSLPESPEKTFIQREIKWMGPLLYPADPVAAQKSYERRIAILEGKLELAEKLYRDGTKDIQQLLAENAKLTSKLGQALQQRRDQDTELKEAAAYARGKDAVIGLLAAVCVLLGALWLYAKVTGLSHVDVARLANRVREGWDPINAIDATVPDRLHEKIAGVSSRLRAKEAARKAANAVL